MSEAALKAAGKGRSQAQALIGWLAVKGKAATLTRVAAHFYREPCTLGHVVASPEERSRNSESLANALT